MHRTHLRGRIGTWRHLELLGSGCELVDQFLGDRFEDVHALHREARLAGIEEPADGDRLARLLDVGVVANDGGVTAAELERDVLQVGRRLRHNLLAGLGLAGESDLADLGVLDHFLANHGAGADHDIENTGRKTTLVHQLDEADGGKGGAAGGLGDHGVPDGEGGRDLVGEQG